jgi:beta-glucosidase/6-phospho-beta-glucosidase/beta-galactosidase
MRFLEQHDMRPIVDGLHHTSFPDWLTGGFSNPDFPDLYVRFLEKFAERYPWVQEYTVFNEPLPTTLFCSYTGMWYPHQRSKYAFVSMAQRVGRAICQASRMLVRRNPKVKLVHVDTAEHHEALDTRAEKWVSFANRRRFLMHDLVLGRVTRQHPLWPYLRSNGMSDNARQYFVDNPGQIDVFGLDYYPHSEMDWYWNNTERCTAMRCPVQRPRGFASVARDYVQRFGLPIMLSETNIRGEFSDRLTWLKFMDEQCHSLVAGGVDFQGFCWYPSIDSTDWCHCCTKCTFNVDPQGIWGLDAQRWKRHPSELSEWYAKLAQGKAQFRELPAYRFITPLDKQLQGYLRLMKHWPKWGVPARRTEAA